MVQHLLAFAASADQAAAAAITALGDTALSPSGTTGYFVPRDKAWLRWGYAVGPNLTRSQIVTPSIGVKREVLELVPARRGTEIVSPSQPSIYIPPEPHALTPGEVIQAWTAEDAAGASQMDVFVSIGPETLPDVPDGDVREMRLTGTTTLTARTWTQVALTPDVTPEPGVYTCVRLLVVGATVLAGRLVFEGGGYRPGSLGLAQTAGNPPDFNATRFFSQPMGDYGMGEFQSTALPSVEVFASAADTAQTVFMWVVRTGELRA